MNRSYSELVKLKTFKERFEYLKIEDRYVGEDVFGHYRYLNQQFYSSWEWRKIRREIIVRDDGCDLGMEGYKIFGKIIIHHLNPVSPDDLLDYNPRKLLLPENLVCVSETTHNAIHYGDEESLLMEVPIERKPGDTKLW